MKTINQKVYVFLGILLVISAELLVYFTQDVLEFLWHDYLVRIPHLLDKLGKVHYQFTLVAQMIFNIHLIFIPLISNVVFMKLSDVHEALHSCIHVTCVA